MRIICGEDCFEDTICNHCMKLITLPGYTRRSVRKISSEYFQYLPIDVFDYSILRGTLILKDSKSRKPMTIKDLTRTAEIKDIDLL